MAGVRTSIRSDSKRFRCHRWSQVSQVLPRETTLSYERVARPGARENDKRRRRTGSGFSAREIPRWTPRAFLESFRGPSFHSSGHCATVRWFSTVSISLASFPLFPSPLSHRQVPPFIISLACGSQRPRSNDFHVVNTWVDECGSTSSRG